MNEVQPRRGKFVMVRRTSFGPRSSLAVLRLRKYTSFSMAF
jgi:hypothetical protein